MVKHNNIIPNRHFHKKWASSSRGPLKVRSFFSQPAQKKQRRLKRAAKAAACAPRPAKGLLKPEVNCPTNKYNMKVRLGRGFSLAELKAAGIPKKLAPSIGIAVDPRRTNKSAESLERNAARLKEYMSKLVVKARSKGDKSVAKKASAKGGGGAIVGASSDFAGVSQLVGTVMPVKAEEVDYSPIPVTDEMKEYAAYSSMRIARNEKRMDGIRKQMKVNKDKEKD
jgi:large subunit ribosomal protein L13e